MNLSESELEFIEGLKDGSAFELLNSEVFYSDSEEPVTISNALWVTPTESKFRIKVRFAADDDIPDEFESFLKGRTGEISKDDLWRIRGETSEGEKIQIVEVIPPTQSNGNGVNVTYALEGCRIVYALEEEPEEGRRKRLADIEELIEKSGFKRNQERSEQQPEESKPREFSYSYLAILPGVESGPRNTSTSIERVHPFHGKLTEGELDSFVFECDKYDCCFETLEADLWIHVRFKIEIINDEAESLRIGDAIMKAIAHLHGCHPWAFLKILKKGCQTRAMEVRPYEQLYSKSAVPLSKPRMMQDVQNTVEFCLSASLFFVSDSESIPYVERVLWLLRQADKPGTAYEIRILAQCSILEGLIDAKWDKIGDKCESPAFRRIKTRTLSLLKRLRERSRNQEVKEMLERLHGYIRGGWSYWRMAERWKMVAESMGMDWEHFEPIFKDWNHYRHPLAHGFKKSKKKKGASSELIAYSRFCGAINLLVASEFEFRGRIEASHLEANGSFTVSG